MFKKIAYSIVIFIFIGIAFFAMILNKRLNENTPKSSHTPTLSEEEVISQIFSKEFSHQE